MYILVDPDEINHMSPPHHDLQWFHFVKSGMKCERQKK